MIRRIAAAVILVATHAGAQAPAPPSAQAVIEVVGVTPIDGSGIEAEKYPANVQVLRVAGESAGDAMLRAGRNVSTAEAQASAFQPDLAFRGFVGSSLLGTAQGLAVFVDGVRFNEPFGDTVNWDLLPQSGVDTAQLIPGANAAFGLNALGGVVALRTKNGLADASQRIRFGGGSFGSGEIDLASGWGRGSRAYFVSLSHAEESGWRDFAPSRLDHLFGSMQWTRARGFSDLKLTAADTSITGNGAAPVQLLAERRGAVFTHPDTTRNRTLLLSSAHSHGIGAGVVEINGYFRRTTTRTLNGDDSPYEPCDEDDDFLCEEDSDERVFDRAGTPFRVTAEESLDAALNRSVSAQTSLGTSAQWTGEGTLIGRTNRLTAGAAIDRGSTEFAFDTEVASLTDSRGATGTGRVAAESMVRLDATTTTSSAFLVDVVNVSTKLLVTGAARFNSTRTRLRDRLGHDLSGDHRFTSFNPSLGVSYDAGVATAFATISQSSRTPTPVELTCADPEDPCRLPNAFVSDPPLRQVTARGGELGVRGRARAAHWSLALFTSANADDIIFVSSGPQRGSGYFTNVGRTKRRGLEAQLEHRGNRLSWSASYALLHATFGETFAVPSPHNPSAVDGEIQVRSGDRIPLLPRHAVKAGAAYRPSERVTIAIDARYASSAFFRGDEGNRNAPLPAYTLIDLGIATAITPRISVELGVRNATNARYQTFGTYGDATEVLGDAYEDARFVSPGAPRRLMLSMTVRR